MAEGRESDHNVLFISIFYIRGKRHRVSLSTSNISWESETSTTDCRTVIPLNQVISVAACDCKKDKKAKESPCYLCRQSFSPASKKVYSELLPLQTLSLRIYYTVPSGRYKWQLASIVFHPVDGSVIRDWLLRLQELLHGLGRPRRLLVYINPYGGKKKGPHIYRKKIAPLFQLAGIEAEVIVTERANHARDMIRDLDLKKFDGLVCVGGDGMFSELLNGLLVRTQTDAKVCIDDPYSSLVHPCLPVGVIPAGSTDAVSYCTTGINDPVTSALHIIMGDRLPIDVISIHQEGSFVRYATSFLAYGYFGDTMLESEKHRWMGTARYDWAGIRTFLKHRSYSGELQMLVTASKGSPTDKRRCLSGCLVCAKAGQKAKLQDGQKELAEERPKWLTVKGRFMGINIATMSCRCGMSRKGIAPSAHLGNGCSDVVMVSQCSHLSYLRYLIRTAIHNKSPLDLNFVQAYRVQEVRFCPNGIGEGESTPVISCTSNMERHRRLSTSIWNCDGEIIQEPAVHMRVHCQLISVFGRGIEDRGTNNTCCLLGGDGGQKKGSG